MGFIDDPDFLPRPNKQHVRGSARRPGQQPSHGLTAAETNRLLTAMRELREYRNTVPPTTWVDITAFGADPTGVADSSPAFAAALASFGSGNAGGVIHIPNGTWRLASPVRIKKSVWLRGTQGHSLYLACCIKPDPGIDGFVFERYNTPIGTQDSGAGDWAQLTNVVISPPSKVADWQANHVYEVGQRCRTGTSAGEDWRRHYVCTQGGQSAASGGPTTFGSDIVDGAARWAYIGGGSGIKIRSNGVTIRDVVVMYASGCGIHIEAQDPEAPGAVANANGWHLQNVDIWQSDGHGLYVNGSDANGGSYIHGVMYGNGGALSDFDFTGPGFNIYDSSFLGNTYVAIQMGSGGQGSVYADSAGGGNVFLGCYVEGSGGGHSVLLNSNVVVGGGMAYGPWSSNSTPVAIGGLGTGRGFGQNIEGSPSGSVGLGSTDANFPYAMFFQGPADKNIGLAHYLQYGTHGGATKTWAFTYGGSGAGGNSGPGLMLAARDTQLSGRHIPAGRAMFDRMFLGGVQLTVGTSTPPDGIYRVGDRHLYATPEAGGREGKVCVTAGTLGTYGGGRTVTATGTAVLTVSGAAMSTLTDQQDFKVGDRLLINGATDVFVTAVSQDGRTVTVSGNVPAGSGLSVAFVPPAFKEFGNIAA